MQPFIGLGLLAFLTRSAALERARHFRCLVATSTLKGSFCRKQDIHVYVKEEEWEVIYRFVIDGKESTTFSRSLCTDMSWRSKSRASLVQRRLYFFVCHQVRQEIVGLNRQ